VADFRQYDFSIANFTAFNRARQADDYPTVYDAGGGAA
jgi:hypothetical protein